MSMSNLDLSLLKNLNNLADDQKMIVNFEANAVHGESCWKKIVEYGVKCGTVEEFSSGIDELEESLLVLRAHAGVNTVFKNGKFNKSRIFDSKQAYSTYRSAKTTVMQALENGISLFDLDNNIVPKSTLTRLIRDKTKEEQHRTPFILAMDNVKRIKSMWDELTNEEKVLIIERVNSLEYSNV